jgi:hypothetical protein
VYPNIRDWGIVSNIDSNTNGKLAPMIDQIRYLQSREPFATFAIELASGRIIQIHNRHSVSTAEGTHREAGVIGVLHQSGTFEVINASLIASVSVGLHPTVKEELDARVESVKKRYGGEK